MPWPWPSASTSRSPSSRPRGCRSTTIGRRGRPALRRLASGRPGGDRGGRPRPAVHQGAFRDTCRSGSRLLGRLGGGGRRRGRRRRSPGRRGHAWTAIPRTPPHRRVGGLVAATMVDGAPVAGACRSTPSCAFVVVVPDLPLPTTAGAGGPAGHGSPRRRGVQPGPDGDPDRRPGRPPAADRGGDRGPPPPALRGRHCSRSRGPVGRPGRRRRAWRRAGREPGRACWPSARPVGHRARAVGSCSPRPGCRDGCWTWRPISPAWSSRPEPGPGHADRCRRGCDQPQTAVARPCGPPNRTPGHDVAGR